MLRTPCPQRYVGSANPRSARYFVAEAIAQSLAELLRRFAGDFQGLTCLRLVDAHQPSGPGDFLGLSCYRLRWLACDTTGDRETLVYDQGTRMSTDDANPLLWVPEGTTKPRLTFETQTCRSASLCSFCITKRANRAQWRHREQSPARATSGPMRFLAFFLF